MTYDDGELQKWIGDRLARTLPIDRGTAAELAAADLVANMPIELLDRLVLSKLADFTRRAGRT